MWICNMFYSAQNQRVDAGVECVVDDDFHTISIRFAMPAHEIPTGSPELPDRSIVSQGDLDDAELDIIEQKLLELLQGGQGESPATEILRAYLETFLDDDLTEGQPERPSIAV